MPRLLTSPAAQDGLTSRGGREETKMPKENHLFRKMVAHGIEWTYRPGVLYTGTYRGFDVTIRRAGARTAITKTPWRLSVCMNNGGSLAFRHQFWPTVEAARIEAIRLIDQHPRSISVA